MKKIPLRKCVACQEMFPKKELLRVVRTPEGEVVIDINGKLNGRGAYICRKAECFTKAEKSKALARSLDCQITEEMHQSLKEAFESFE